MTMAKLTAKAELFETLASRAAYAAATCPNKSDAAQWAERADLYDTRAAMRKAA